MSSQALKMHTAPFSSPVRSLPGSLPLRSRASSSYFLNCHDSLAFSDQHLEHHQLNLDHLPAINAAMRPAMRSAMRPDTKALQQW